MRRSTSSKAHRGRTSWFIIIVDVKGTKEMHLCWRYYDGRVGLFSSVGNSCKTRPGWGPVIDCSFETLQNGRKETHDYYKFQNRSFEKKSFKIDEWNNFLWEVNDLTNSMFEMRQAGKEKLLALYLSLMPKSKLFSNHKEGVLDNNGLRIDKTGVTEDSLKESGGSVEEFEEFLEKAVSSALLVNSKSEILDNLPKEVKKRKNDEKVPAKAKKSKDEKVNDSKAEELKDKAGLETDFRKRFIGRADVPLKNISLSSSVSLPINSFKVKGLVKSMLECYDPTQMVLMVTPVKGKSFNPAKLEENTYEVFHGRHRYLAVKQIQEKGRLTELEGFEHNSIICQVVNIISGGSIQANYGVFRGNEIQAKYTRPPYLHEMIYILESIRQSNVKDKCEETMMRIGKLFEFGADDLTAIRKFSRWSEENLKDLSGVFKLYESCKTTDAKTFVKRKSEDIRKGKTIEFPRKLFRKFASMDEDYFKDSLPGVTRKELSLKDLIENFSKILIRRNTASLVQQEFGSSSFGEVKTLFPGKFEDKTLDSFAGAAIGDNENDIGTDLQDYCRSIIEEKEAVPKLTFTEITSFAELDLEKLGNPKTIVINIEDVKSDLIGKMEHLKLAYHHVSFILIFANQDQQLEVYELLKDDVNKKVFTPRKICFLKETPKVVNKFSENMVHGIVCCANIYQAPLKEFNGPIANLDGVVNQISPPGSTLVFINEGNLKFKKIHSKYPCQYIGDKPAINIFTKVLANDTGDTLSGDVNEVEENCVGSIEAEATGNNEARKELDESVQSSSVVMTDFSPVMCSTFISKSNDLSTSCDLKVTDSESDSSSDEETETEENEVNRNDQYDALDKEDNVCDIEDKSS